MIIGYLTDLQCILLVSEIFPIQINQLYFQYLKKLKNEEEVAWLSRTSNSEQFLIINIDNETVGAIKNSNSKTNQKIPNSRSRFYELLS